MADGSPRDPLTLVVGVMAIAFAVALAVYALLWPTASAPAAQAQNVDDLERALASAKRGCIDGGPQNPSCAEAARLTTAIAKARASR
jgi:hypothetical protein